MDKPQPIADAVADHVCKTHIKIFRQIDDCETHTCDHSRVYDIINKTIRFAELNCMLANDSLVCCLQTPYFNSNRNRQFGRRFNKMPGLRANTGSRSKKLCTQQQLPRRTPLHINLRNDECPLHQLFCIVLADPKPRMPHAMRHSWDLNLPGVWEMTGSSDR